MDALQQLLDRAELSELMSQYAAGVDLLDRDLYQSCFTDPVEIDFGSFDDAAVKAMTPAEWADYCWDLIERLDSTQHIITNHRITFNGDDEATIIAYMHAQHYLQDIGGYIAAGYYTNRAVRTADGWRLARVRFTLTWESGDRNIFEIQRERPIGTRVRPA
jgi:hypothetical protein